MVKPGQVAAAAGAGLAGTAAMTVSSTIEMKLRGRSASSAPAQAAAMVLGVQPVGEKESKRFGTLVRWAYGTGWGATRGILSCLGLPAPAATAAHFAVVWGSEQIMLPALGVTPPATQWGAKELAIDTWHHLVYAADTGGAYELLDPSRHTAHRAPSWQRPAGDDASVWKRGHAVGVSWIRVLM